MVDLIDEPVDVSTHGVFNWILLLTIFSVITVIGNYIGYGHPLADSFIGMGILALITLIGVWLERKLPLDISSIIYISLIGIFIAFPGVPTSETVLYYVSKVELLSIVTVFLAYGMSSKLLDGKQLLLPCWLLHQHISDQLLWHILYWL